MNNEPVAWMELYYGEPNNLAWTNAELRDSGEVYKTIPLYTHPAKTLTDEEIHKAEYEFMYWNRSLKEPLVKLASELYVFEQAVAILRKAQGK
jgi:hypothetical protein